MTKWNERYENSIGQSLMGEQYAFVENVHHLDQMLVRDPHPDHDLLLDQGLRLLHAADVDRPRDQNLDLALELHLVGPIDADRALKL